MSPTEEMINSCRCTSVSSLCAGVALPGFDGKKVPGPLFSGQLPTDKPYRVSLTMNQVLLLGAGLLGITLSHPSLGWVNYPLLFASWTAMRTTGE